MRVTEVIPSKRWKNKINGRTASIYGAHPAGSPAEREQWEIETVGWTWRCDDGTVGLCRVPVKTYEEAVEVMNRVNNRQ